MIKTSYTYNTTRNLKYWDIWFQIAVGQKDLAHTLHLMTK